MQDAVDAVGKGDSLLDILETLQEDKVIRSFDFIVEIKVDRDKAVSLENFFMSKIPTVSNIRSKRKGSEDYD
jgi:hypothetical protein